MLHLQEKQENFNTFFLGTIQRVCTLKFCYYIPSPLPQPLTMGEKRRHDNNSRRNRILSYQLPLYLPILTYECFEKSLMIFWTLYVRF